jgi:hypothetical protein
MTPTRRRVALLIDVEAVEERAAYGQHLRPDTRAVLLGDFNQALSVHGNHCVGIGRLIVAVEGVRVAGLMQAAHLAVAATMVEKDLQQQRGKLVLAAEVRQRVDHAAVSSGTVGACSPHRSSARSRAERIKSRMSSKFRQQTSRTATLAV